MKRAICAFLLIVLVMSLSPAAMALSAAPEAKLNGNFYGDTGSSVFLRSYTDTSALFDLKGEAVVKLDGVRAASYDRTAIVTDKDSGLCGLYGEDGRELLSMEYDRIEMHDVWAMGIHLTAAKDQKDWDFSNGLTGERYIIDTADVINWETGRAAATLDRSSLGDWNAWNGCLNIRDRSGVITSYDSNFKKLSAQVEDVCSFSYARTEYRPKLDSKTGKYALEDTTGKLLTDARYESITCSSTSSYSVITDKKGKQGLLDDSGREVVPMKYDRFLQLPDLQNSTGGAVTESHYETCGVICAATGKAIELIDTATGKTVKISCSPDSASFLGTVVADKDKDDVFYGTDGKKISFPKKVTDISAKLTTAGVIFLGTNSKDNTMTAMDDTGNVLVTAKTISVTRTGRILAYNAETKLTEVYTVK